MPAVLVDLANAGGPGALDRRGGEILNTESGVEVCCAGVRFFCSYEPRDGAFGALLQPAYEPPGLAHRILAGRGVPECQRGRMRPIVSAEQLAPGPSKPSSIGAAVRMQRDALHGSITPGKPPPPEPALPSALLDPWIQTKYPSVLLDVWIQTKYKGSHHVPPSCQSDARSSALSGVAIGVKSREAQLWFRAELLGAAWVSGLDRGVTEQGGVLLPGKGC